MDDSDQDFTDLCSRLLKRVKRKGAEGSGDEKRSAAGDEESCSLSAARNPPKRKKKSTDVKPGIKSSLSGRTVTREASQPVFDAAETGRVKEAVIRRMQRFKRAGPERLLHEDTNQPSTAESDGNGAAPTEIHRTDPTGEPDGDEALALQLQQEMDREASVGVEEGGLFFCQLCQKDLSAMSPQLRTQHINRCLDAGENSAPSASHDAHPMPRVPECPICGKGFKSEKSRTVHLKRCSTNMGVSPNDLLLALRRQAAETESDSATDQSRQIGGANRRNGIPVKKKTRRRAKQLDEDTMMAMALSRSLLDQEREKEREMEEEREIQAQLSSPPAAAVPALHWKPGAGKGRGKRRKGASPVHPPLLLIQDPQTALSRLQERVSSLLLCPRAPSPPTPTFSPSTLSDFSHPPLWMKSALPGGGPHSVSEFYTSELSSFIQPWVGPEREKLKSLEVTPTKNPPALTSEAAEVQEKHVDRTPAQHQSAPSPLIPCQDTPGTQALQDLMELAEEGMTLTQYRCTLHTATDKETALPELPLSGFVPETNESKNTKSASVSVSKLASDLSSMVNNPQLSDVQLQVDSGDVFFTHSFMLYTRCPLLANMVHNTGFGVQEEGLPAAQRVLLGDVPSEAVLALLQYLYTAHCPLTHTLLPHLQELADRFDLAELQQQCTEYSGGREDDPGVESKAIFSVQEPRLGGQDDQNLAESNFLELLQSMWQHEDSEGEDEFKENVEEERGMVEEGERGDGEFQEDRVDEEELDEIYEFAATQRKMETMLETATETEDEEGEAITSLENEKRDEGIEKNETESLFEKSATSCHSNKQGVDGTAASMVTSPAETHQIQNPETGGHKLCLIRESEAHVNENRDPDASLDRSYNRLFSQSVGEYMDPSQTPACSSQPQRYKPSHTLQRNTPAPFRPSSVSEVIDLSISPPLSSGVSGESSFPVPGLSPVSGKGEDVGQSGLQKEISPGHRISNPPSPSVSHSKQTELIVLSDSGEEMEVDIDRDAAIPKRPPDGGAQSLSPSPLKSPLKSESYAWNGVELNTENAHSSGPQDQSGKEVQPAKPCNHVTTDIEPGKSDQSEHCSPNTGDRSVFDGSAEVSWLIPATPVPSTRCNSSQTCISMRRTQLFPKSCSSSSSSSSSTIPDSSKPGAGFASTNSSNLKDNPLKTNLGSSKERSSTDTEPSPGYQKLPHLRLSQVSCKMPSDGSLTGIIIGRPTQSVPQPSSSTPLHSDISLQRQIQFGSPTASDCEGRPLDSRGNCSFSFSQVKGGQLSLQLSHSKSSPSPTETPEKEYTKRTCSPQHGSSSQSLKSQNYSPPEGSRESKTKQLDKTEDDIQCRGVDEVVDLEKNSPEVSFCGMDEPPIAFDDSWGLDGAVGSQKARFSLRLDSSDGTSSPPDQVKGEGQAVHIQSSSPSLPGPHTEAPLLSPGPFNHSLPEPEMWDDWEEEEDDNPLPLSQRLPVPAAKRVAELRTPVVCRKKNKGPLVPITPMPGFSDMDTPELKNRLNRFGVRPLPKKQMVLKLKEIHQYTHQLQSSESEEETSPPRHPPQASSSQSALLSFKQPRAPSAASPVKLQQSEDEELLSASQNSNTSSTAESDRSNPELCVSEDDDSDSEGVTASQAVVREKDKLLAVRQFILSNPKLYGQVLQYQPLSLAELQASLKAAGIRLGAAKLLDFLDSQCITFSTAKQGHDASSRRKRRGKTATNGPGGAAGRGRKKTTKNLGGLV